ncbi:head GIN domain-containing protein [Maribacter sp. HTCC2170]|uniref:head GIN domain-containing protein n=1 Tax=Maribacter sp. (strain HTCC2170 / KCCM 42371) TaxID=313603 RepID=UPI00006AFD61|nr:head GIN domain-containing protein [Maribacter sp. HTCC2170]EAR01237.1 hypothetical protein FB2170_10971 [Maribacter sp. HTCC2170]
MKTKSVIFGLVFLCALITSCDHDTIRAKGAVTVNEVQLSGYTGLELSNAFDAYVKFSDSEEKIEIEANDNLHEKIVVKIEGNNLIVKLKNHTTVKGNATLNVYITTNNINYFNISGASAIFLEDELNTQTAKIRMSGASTFSGDIYANEVQLKSSGASDISLFGNVDVLDANLSGSSKLGGYDLITEKLNIDLSGASDANLTVLESIDIKASGASSLRYKGDAVIDHKDLSGASEIIKKD